MFFRRLFLPWVNLRLLVYALNDRETRHIFRKYKAGLLWAALHNSQGTLHGLPELGSTSFSTILSVALALPVCLPIGFYFVGVGISPRLCILVHGFSIIAPPVATIFPDRQAVFFSPSAHIFPACVLCFIGQNNHSFLNWFAFDGGGDYPPFSSMVFCEYLHHTKGEAS